MPLINTTYSKTASVLPLNATNIIYTWTVDGTIVSGQSTNTVNYRFNTIGTKSLNLTTSNSCSTRSNSTSFTVCEPIGGLSIVRVASIPIPNIVVGGSYTYSLANSSGVPLNPVWDIVGELSIVSGQNTSEIIVNVTGSNGGTLGITVRDCDNNSYVTSTKISVLCVAITSCSIN
jgi:hypothetical protein